MSKTLQTINKQSPIHFLIHWSKRWKPPGFQGITLYDVFRYIFKNFDLPYLTESAAAISYNFILSIPPTFLFLFTIVPNLPFLNKANIRVELHSLIRDVIPSSVYNKELLNFVDSFINGSKIGLISFTFILSLFFASNGVIGLIRSFNKKSFVGFETRKGLKRRWDAIKLTLMLFALLILCLVLLLLQKNILNWLGVEMRIRNFILYGKWIFIIGLIFSSFAFIYRYAPSTTKRWKLVSPGAVLATFLSIIVTIGFSFFVENFGRYNLLYGSIGTVMVVMIMIFLNSLAIFLGFVLNLSIHTLKSERENALKNPDSQELNVAVEHE